jgi:hypothetical protein
LRLADGVLGGPAQAVYLSFGGLNANTCFVCLRLGVISLLTLSPRLRLSALGRAGCVARSGLEVALFGA